MEPNNYSMPSPPPGIPVGLPKKQINRLLFPFILTLLFLIGALSFGFWAFVEREDYKKNSDQKSAVAVTAAEKVLDAKKEADFTEREKEPLKEYKGNPTFGSVVIKYPKTWSGYVTESDRGGLPLDGYLHPDIVPSTTSGTAFALHFQVTNTAYDQELKKYETDTRSGAVSVSPVTAPKVAGVTGVRIVGQVVKGKQGVTLLFPLRDKTLKITTEAQDFVGDLDTHILPNLTFVP